MENCEGCYYEERPPMEACNLCERDQDGDMTGWVPREKMETAQSDARSHWKSKNKNEWGEYEIIFASRDRETAKMVERVCQLIMDEENGRTRAGTTVEWDLADKMQPRWVIPPVLPDPDLEENLLMQIEEQRKQIEAWQEEIDVLRGEREDLRIMLEKAKAEANYYKECLANETRLRELAYAKLDMVHLIFGGGNNA